MRVTSTSSNGRRRCPTVSSCLPRTRLGARFRARDRRSARQPPGAASVHGLRIAGSPQEFTDGAAYPRAAATKTRFRSRPRTVAFARGGGLAPDSLERVSPAERAYCDDAARADYCGSKTWPYSRRCCRRARPESTGDARAARGGVRLDVTVGDQGVRRLPISRAVCDSLTRLWPCRQRGRNHRLRRFHRGRGAGASSASRRAMRRSTGRNSGGTRSGIEGTKEHPWQRFSDGVSLWLDDAVADSGHGVARGSSACSCARAKLP